MLLVPVYILWRNVRKNSLDFHDTFEQVSIQFVKKKLILFRVTYKYVFAVRCMALCFFSITSRYYFIEFQSRFYIAGVSTYEWESPSVTTLCCLIIVGECKSRFTSRKVPYCIKYHPEEDKQHLFVAGTSDKKIVCVSDLFHANSFIQHFHNVHVMLTIYNLTTPWASLEGPCKHTIKTEF